MNTLSPFYSIDCPCDEALAWAQKQLSQAGLRVMQTFDLHTARHALEDCPCPNHGTDQCDCQMVVLLVYGKLSEPITLILHGNNSQTWVSIADNPSQQANEKLITIVKQALEVKAPVSVSQRG